MSTRSTPKSFSVNRFFAEYTGTSNFPINNLQTKQEKPPNADLSSSDAKNNTRAIIQKISIQAPASVEELRTLVCASWIIVQRCYTGTTDIGFFLRTSNCSREHSNQQTTTTGTVTDIPVHIKLDDINDEPTCSDLCAHTREILAQSTQQAKKTDSDIDINVPCLNDDYTLGCLRFESEEERFRGGSGENEQLGHPLEISCCLRGSNSELLFPSCGSAAIITYTARYDSNLLDSKLLARVLRTLGTFTQTLQEHSEQQLSSIMQRMSANTDIAELWGLNHDVTREQDARQRGGEDTLHGLIRKRAHEQPATLAIEAWDEEKALSYAELEQRSERLALMLRDMGATKGAMIGLCLGRSAWYIIGMVAALKAGCAFVPLDPDWPETQRDAVLTKTACPVVMLSSRTKASRFPQGTRLLLVPGDVASSEGLAVQEAEVPVHKDPRAVAYVLFTSGSTGEPKGVVIDHRAVCTTLIATGRKLGLGTHTRMLQFAVPTFDIFIAETMGTLVFGGCVVVPSDVDRMMHLPEYIVEKQVNNAALTPTTARLFSPENVPCLKTLTLGGEAMTAADVQKWRNVRLFNGFGPTECAVCCAMQRIDPAHGVAGIGRLDGIPLWVVDPLDCHMLVPWGAVGELLVEGSTIARGYLANAAATQEAFIEDPPWLLQGFPPEFPGRRGRLYKTGDLVQYQQDGTLIYVGRKADDRQVKVRGQRLDLAHVQFHVQDCVPAATDVIVEAVQTNTGSAMLIAFLCFSNKIAENGCKVPCEWPQSAQVHDQLALRLPAYMIPTAFLQLESVLKMPTGKTNHRELHRQGSLFLASRRNPAPSDDHHTPLAPPNAQALREIWAAVLQIPEESIGLASGFVKLGGDSIAAIQVVRRARETENITLTVAQLLHEPTLDSLAALSLEGATILQAEHCAPFSLLSNQGYNIAHLRREIAASCSIQDAACVQDVYPCTPLQESFLYLSSHHSGTYTIQKVLQLDPRVKLQHFKHAWESVVQATSILRTRITQHARLGLVQVVSSEPLQWNLISSTSGSLQAYLDHDREKPMTIDQPLMRCAITDAEHADTPCYFVWSIHHALYDGWSVPLILERLRDCYHDRAIPTSDFAPFIQWSQCGVDEEAMRSHWQMALQGVDESGMFPSIPSSVREPLEDSSMEYTWSMPESGSSDVEATPANLLLAAWGLVASSYASTFDVVFGATTSGRTAPVVGIQNIVGPTVATIPFRVRWQLEQKVRDFLKSVQNSSTAGIPFEQAGLEKIAKMSPEMGKVRRISTFFIVQPQAYGEEENPGFGRWVNGPGNYRLDVSALTLELFLGAGNVRCKAYFDSRVVSKGIVKKCLMQLGHVSQQFVTVGSNSTLEDISILTLENVDEIWSWNRELLEPALEALPHRDLETHVHRRPHNTAVDAWDARLTYEELWFSSGRLAQRLLSLGAGPGHVVLIFSEPSGWVAASMIAVLRTGASFVPVAVDGPEARLAQLLCRIKPTVYITSSGTRIPRVLETAGIEHMRVPMNETRSEHLTQPLPESIDVDSPAWMITTSGSTGTPKTVVLAHAAVHTSFRKLGGTFTFSAHTRMLQFASYAFDACVLEIVGTLMHGGCVCIPNVSLQRSIVDLPRMCRDMSVNTAILTPTVARLLNATDLGFLESLVLTGEGLVQADLDQWANVPRLYNAYGPAECANMSAVRRIHPGADDPNCIGRLTGVASWVVHAETPARLTPVGGIGEIVVEGVTIASGYLHEPERTAAAFIDPPAWLRDRAGEQERRGRLYRTGDLGQLNEDGSISYRSRKDTQVKIHGQRVELGEIEHHCVVLTGAPEVIVEVVASTVVAFLRAATGTESGPQVVAGAERECLVDALADRLPAYMVPRFIIRIAEIPRAATGKANRKKMHELAKELLGAEHQRQRDVPQRTLRPARSKAEVAIAQAWATALSSHVQWTTIGLDDRFEQMGGSSIEAMKVASLSRQAGLPLSVDDVLRLPTLEEQARHAIEAAKHLMAAGEIPTTGPEQRFALLPLEVDRASLADELAHMCGVAADKIEDAMPCTPSQLGLFSLAAQDVDGEAYILRHVFRMPATVSVERVVAAWRQAMQRIEIMRTRIVYHLQAGLVQVVVQDDERMEWKTVAEQEINQGWPLLRMELGSPLVDFVVVGGGSGSEWKLVCAIHHAVADGWTLELILDHVRALLSTATPPGKRAVYSFRPFLQYLARREQDAAASEEYWRRQMADLQGTAFPRLPSMTATPVESAAEELTFPLPRALESARPTVTVLRSAWAIVQAAHSACRDIVFAEVRSGRSASIDGIEHLVGPTMTTVPFRVQLGASATVDDLLREVQHTARETMVHEHLGLRRIGRLDANCEAACAAQTLIVIQPPPVDNAARDASWLLFREPPAYRVRNYALCIELTPAQADSALASGSPLSIHAIARFDAAVLPRSYAQRLLAQLAYVAAQLVASPKSTPCTALSILPAAEQAAIWSWTATDTSPPPAPPLTIVDSFLDRARHAPDAIAVRAWDGEFTYSHLQHLSAALARRLPCQSAVPVYLSKSRWSVVAYLAVLRSGAAVVPLDPAHPPARTDAILAALRRRLSLSTGWIALVSASLVARWSTCAPDCIPLALSDYLLDQLLAETHAGDCAIPIPLDSLCWILHTSGSTGVPKGVLLHHGAIAHSFQLLLNAFGLDASTRILQFSSYAFDSSTWEMFAPLLVGGSTCIPSDSQRIGDLPAFCATAGVNTAVLTPTVARMHRPQDFPTLKALHLIGEPVQDTDVQTWEHLQLYDGFGPCEASVMCSVYRIPQHHRHNQLHPARPYAGRLGRLPHVPLWVCDPNNVDSLTPIGAVGELVIEGTTLAHGYLDPDHTAHVFVQDPVWLLRGVEGHILGRQGRLYRTGDLVVSNEKGDLFLAGRKDDQVKIRGQRIELADIEHHVLTCLSDAVRVTAEVDTRDKRRVVALVETRESISVSTPATTLAPYFLSQHAKTLLRERLPAIMIPQVWIALASIPMTSTGKTDRRQMKSLITMYHEQAHPPSLSHPPDEPWSQMESALQRAWSHILHLNSEAVARDSNFFDIGGDSISSLELQAALKAESISLHFTDIYQHPVLHDMANFLLDQQAEASPPPAQTFDIPPLSLLPLTANLSTIVDWAAALCAVQPSDVEDVFPCTPLQAGIMALSRQNVGTYVSTFLLTLDDHFDMNRFQFAWSALLDQMSILRTRVVDHPAEGFLQVIIKAKHPDMAMVEFSSDTIADVTLGPRLSRWHLVPRHGQQPARFILQLHHALYDDASLQLLIDHLKSLYYGLSPEPLADYRIFIKQLLEQNSSAQNDFWNQYLDGCDAAVFPALPVAASLVSEDATLDRSFACPSVAAGVGRGSLLRAAWGVVASWHTRCEDVVFGDVRLGRDTKNMDRMPGPTIATVPFRLRADPAMLTVDFIRHVRDQINSTKPYEQVGLQRLQRLSSGCAHACRFQTLLSFSVRDPDDGNTFEQRAGGLGTWEAGPGFRLNSYALILQCSIEEYNIHIHASFDSAIIDSWRVDRLLLQFGSVVRKLASSSMGVETRLRDLETVEDSGWRTIADCHRLEGRRSWLVFPDDHTRLAPIGALGEYVYEQRPFEITSDEAKSSCNGFNQFLAANLRSSGKFMRYGPDGELVYMGSKDATIWHVGQHLNTVEFVDVCKEHLPPDATIVVDMIACSGAAQLAVFIQQGQCVETDVSTRSRLSAHPDADMIKHRLSRNLRPNLIPAYYFDVTYLPMNELGAVDRVQLRELGVLAVLEMTEHTSATKQNRRALQGKQAEMARIWARVLRRNEGSIAAHDNFFAIGGDSMSVMSLVTSAQTRGLSLTAVDVLRWPVLVDLVSNTIWNPARSQLHDGTDLPFALTVNDNGVDREAQVEAYINDEILPAVLDADRDEVDDVLPCSYMQKEYIRAGGLLFCFRLDFGWESLDFSVLETAVAQLIARHSVLRTVFTLTARGNEMVQVIMRSGAAEQCIHINVDPHERHEDVATGMMQSSQATESPLKHRNPRFVLLTSKDGEYVQKQELLILSLSHAQFDGFSLPLLIRDLADLYSLADTGSRTASVTITPATQFSALVYAQHRIPAAKIRMYWQRLLHGCRAMPLTSPNFRYQDDACSELSVLIPMRVWERCSRSLTEQPNMKRVPASDDIMTAAWALCLACTFGITDVLFGHVVNGRRALAGRIPATESVVGSLANIIPVRMKILDGGENDNGEDAQPSSRSLCDMLQDITAQNTRSAGFEFVDLDDVVSQYAPPGLWQEVPGGAISSSDRRFRWGSAVVWQDFAQMQKTPDGHKTDYLSPYASSTSPSVSFAGRTCFMHSQIPAQDIANLTVIGRPMEGNSTVCVTFQSSNTMLSGQMEKFTKKFVEIIEKMGSEEGQWQIKRVRGKVVLEPQSNV